LLDLLEIDELLPARLLVQVTGNRFELGLNPQALLDLHGTEAARLVGAGITAVAGGIHTNALFESNIRPAR
jgi:hypothetical protein